MILIRSMIVLLMSILLMLPLAAGSSLSKEEDEQSDDETYVVEFQDENSDLLIKKGTEIIDQISLEEVFQKEERWQKEALGISHDGKKVFVLKNKIALHSMRSGYHVLFLLERQLVCFVKTKNSWKAKTIKFEPEGPLTDDGTSFNKNPYRAIKFDEKLNAVRLLRRNNDSFKLISLEGRPG